MWHNTLKQIHIIYNVLTYIFWHTVGSSEGGPLTGQTQGSRWHGLLGCWRIISWGLSVYYYWWRWRLRQFGGGDRVWSYNSDMFLTGSGRHITGSTVILHRISLPTHTPTPHFDLKCWSHQAVNWTYSIELQATCSWLKGQLELQVPLACQARHIGMVAPPLQIGSGSLMACILILQCMLLHITLTISLNL